MVGRKEEEKVAVDVSNETNIWLEAVLAGGDVFSHITNLASIMPSSNHSSHLHP